MAQLWTPYILPPNPEEISELSVSALKIQSFLERHAHNNLEISGPEHAELKINFDITPVIKEGSLRNINPLKAINEPNNISNELRNSNICDESSNDYTTRPVSEKSQLKTTTQAVARKFNQFYSHDFKEKLITEEYKNFKSEKESEYFDCKRNELSETSNHLLNYSADMFEDAVTHRNLEVINASNLFEFPKKQLFVSTKEINNKIAPIQKITNDFPLIKTEGLIKNSKLPIMLKHRTIPNHTKDKENMEVHSENHCGSSVTTRILKGNSDRMIDIRTEAVLHKISLVKKYGIKTVGLKNSNINSFGNTSLRAPCKKARYSNISEKTLRPMFCTKISESSPLFKDEEFLKATNKFQHTHFKESMQPDNNFDKPNELEETYNKCLTQVWTSPQGSEPLRMSYHNQDLMFHQLTSDNMAEIGMTLCYKEHFCLLNKGERKDCEPKDILLCAKYLDGSHKVFLFANDCFKSRRLREILLKVLESLTRKICYESQALVLFILDNIEFNDPRTCYNWCILDPLIGSWLLDPDNPPSSFDDLQKQYLNQEMQSDGNWLTKCSNLLLLQSRVMEILYSELTKEDIWNVFLYLETRIIPILSAMESSEITIDIEKVNGINHLIMEKLNSLEKEAERLVGYKISLNSTQQIRKVIYDELKLDSACNVNVKGTNIKGVKSTSESMLKLLVGLHPLPEVILEYRQLFKLKSAYTDVILEHTCGENTISAMWDLCSTATGRVSSSNPNLQGIPRGIITVKLAKGETDVNLRSCFIARDDFSLISADFQHIELRIFAVLAKDKLLLGLIRKSDDIFTTITQRRLNKIDITPEERTQTKTLVYALMYGAGNKRIAELLSINYIEAAKVRNKFLGIFPGLQQFSKTVLKEVQRNKALRSISGRKRLFPNISSFNLVKRKATERQAVNFVIQGSAADICKGAMLRTETNLKDRRVRSKLLMQIHDELLWEVHRADIDCFQEIVQESMEANRRFWMKHLCIDIPLPVAVKIGKDWGSLQKTKYF